MSQGALKGRLHFHLAELIDGEVQSPADAFADVDSLFKEQAALGSFLNQSLNVTAGHDGEDDIGLSFVLPHIVDGDNVGVVAKTSHGLGFTFDARSSFFVQLLGLYQGEGNIPIKYGIMGQVDLLLTTFAEEFLDLVAAAGKGGRLR